MSNDVHLAKVSKIQRSTNITKIDMVNKRHNMGRILVDSLDVQPNLKSTDDGDFLFGSISPRGATAQQQMTEIDSPDHTQRDTNESDNNISSCSTLDIVNKVDNLSLHQLETKVRELTQQLQQADEERTKMRAQLDECSAGKEQCQRRLEVVTAAHECRITEMHCVIAELSKKLRAKQESTILEEQEPEGSEISFQEGSCYNSELNLTNPDAECQTDTLDRGNYSAYNGCENDDENFCSDFNDDFKLGDNVNKGQVETLQEEVFHLKAQIALLQSEIANSLRLNNEKTIEEPQSIEFYGKQAEADESNFSVEHLNFDAKETEPQHYFSRSQSGFIETNKCESILNSHKITPIPKMAERVKLHCASKTVVDKITTIDLLNNSKKTDIMEAPLEQNNSTLEISLMESTHISNELQQLERKIEHLKIRNTLLSLTMAECKEHCEHLYLLCGKYESNAIALQTAVNCSDRAIEAYDVMLALLESKLALMKEKSQAAEESRMAVESVARHLLDRLESEKNICENSLGPWQNNIPERARAPWTMEDDNRLRYHVSKLKGRRSTVQNTIVNLESPFSDCYEKSRLALENGRELLNDEKTEQMDLETAALMQELLNLQDENMELKTKTEEANKERQYAMSRMGVLQEALQQLQLQLATESNELFHPDNLLQNRISYPEIEHAAVTEQQLVEALTRESKLKGRIQTLVASVAASQKIYDEKYKQLHNNIRRLQKSNLNLNQQFEQSKQKYQTRLRKLENKIIELTLESAEQISSANCVDEPQQPRRLKCKSTFKTLHHDNVPETTL